MLELIKTHTGRKTKKSAKEDAVGVEPDRDNGEEIKFSEAIEDEIAEEIAA